MTKVVLVLACVVAKSITRLEVAAPPEPSAPDEDLIEATLEASESLFDDGDDAPELTEPERGELDGAAPDASLFESPGTDLASSARRPPKKKS